MAERGFQRILRVLNYIKDMSLYHDKAGGVNYFQTPKRKIPRGIKNGINLFASWKIPAGRRGSIIRQKTA